MDIIAFKQKFDPLLARHLASQHTLYKKITTQTDVLAILEHIQQASNHGKRFRPFIVWSFYATNKEDAQIEDIIDLLIATELFHIFCLIHDDVMDEASTRHGVATIHAFTKTRLEQKNEIGNIVRASESQAILAGDIVFNQVYKLLNKDSWSTPEIRSNIRSVFEQLIDEVCIGQMLDINLTTKAQVTFQDIEEKNRLKTAYYSFARPLHIGAILSGYTDSIPFMLSFGECIGMLFQIQDDLLDVTGDPQQTKKNLFTDIFSNQHTVLTQYIQEKLDKTYMHKLNAFRGQTKDTVNEAEIKALFVESGATTYAQTLINAYEKKALEMIHGSALKNTLKQNLESTVSLLMRRTS